jgi:hypothetical protein
MLGVQGYHVLIEQVSRLGGEALGFPNIQSFYKTKCSIMDAYAKLVPLGIPMYPIFEWGGLSLSNFYHLPFELL